VLTGEVRARHEVDLAFRVGGKILRRQVDSGQEIRPGQLLAELDPADLRLAASAAAAQLAAAESDLATASAERQRYAELLAKKFVSQAAFDSRDNAFNAARARLEQARSQSQLSANQAAYGALVSSFPAVVSAVLADAGQVVAAGQPVLRVARPEEKEVLVRCRRAGWPRCAPRPTSMCSSGWHRRSRCAASCANWRVSPIRRPVPTRPASACWRRRRASAWA